MATTAEEIQYLKEKNNELVQKVQYWMTTAAQREDEKLALMKENNELRLKLSRLRNSGATLANNLGAAIQTASEQALSHLVQASTEMTHIAEVTKAYMRDRLGLEVTSSRWSTLNGSPTTDKADRVHRVPPMLIGGQSIQPVVALSRTLLNTSYSQPQSRSINENRSASVRAVPMHMLQDVYIPLTRIDAGSRQTNNRNSESDIQNQSAENSAMESDVEDYTEDRVTEDSQHMSESGEDYELLRLEPVTEEVEPEVEVTQPRIGIDNPLEGPSWLLDAQTSNITSNRSSKHRVTLEPDSTTGADEVLDSELLPVIVTPERDNVQKMKEEDVVALHVFTPTVRRRKRTCLSPVRPLQSPVMPVLSPRSPIFPPSKPLTTRRNSMSGRVLKVLVAKMRLTESDDDNGDVSPPKRSAHCGPVSMASPYRSPTTGIASPGAAHYARFDAPSPNGATDAKVIVLETKKERDSASERENVPPEGQSDNLWRNVSRRVKQERVVERRSRARSNTSSDSDSTAESLIEGRTRRNRKPVTYKEKPLNRKMRR